VIHSDRERVRITGLECIAGRALSRAGPRRDVLGPRDGRRVKWNSKPLPFELRKALPFKEITDWFADSPSNVSAREYRHRMNFIDRPGRSGLTRDRLLAQSTPLESRNPGGVPANGQGRPGLSLGTLPEILP
jgi:hypothetical protein